MSIPKYLFSPKNIPITIFKKLYNIFLDIFFPKFCLLCLKWNNSYFCKSCLEKINFEPSFHCLLCEKRLDFNSKCSLHSRLIRKIISFGVYEENKLKEIIIMAKEFGYREVFKDLGRKMGERIINLNLKDYQLAFVPLHYKKFLLRGFNQSEELAKGINEILNLEIFDGLEKIKETKDQTELNFEERKNNLKGAFALNKKPPEKIILVDDIKTTGSTLLEIAKILKENGTKEIIALTILR
ncbi:MAG: hypothetical protein C4278_00215 [Patescibacteria group bacterium]